MRTPVQPCFAEPVAHNNPLLFTVSANDYQPIDSENSPIKVSRIVNLSQRRSRSAYCQENVVRNLR
jgi:hypothetical protein